MAAGVYARKDSKFLWVRYKDGSGRWRCESSHTDKVGVARGLLARRQAAAQVGESPARCGQVTLGMVLERYRATVQHQPSYEPVRKHLLAQVKARLGALPMARLSTYELQRWQSELLAEGKTPNAKRALIREKKLVEAAKIEQEPMKPAAVNKLIGQVKAIVARAVEWGMATPAQLLAVRRVHQLDEGPGRVRYLSTVEAQALLDACDDSLRAVVGLVLLTGCRPGEVLGLRWEWVDYEQGLLLLPTTKPGRARQVPLSDRAIEVLRSLPREDGSPWVFPGHGTDSHQQRISKGFAAAVKRAKLADLHPHDMRHTFASWMIQDGENLRIVQELLGHSRPQVTSRYAHLGRADLHAAVERLSARRRSA